MSAVCVICAITKPSDPGGAIVVARSHATPANPLTEAKTATGGSFHSDGRILVLVLKAPQVAGNN